MADVPRETLERLVLRVPEVARILDVSESQVYRRIAAGDLPAVRIGASVRVPRRALEEWIEASVAPRAG